MLEKTINNAIYALLFLYENPTRSWFQIRLAIDNTQFAKSHRFHCPRRCTNIFCSGWSDQNNRYTHVATLLDQITTNKMINSA